MLTFGHGLKVHLAAVASKPRHRTCSHLEHVDASGFEAAYDRGVGLTFYYGRIMFRLVLQQETGKKLQGEKMEKNSICT